MSWKRQQTKQAFDCMYTPFQEVDKLISTCQEDMVRVHSPEEMLFGDLWTRSWLDPVTCENFSEE